VKSDSIWLQKVEQSDQWQELKKGSHVKALAACGDKLLSDRDAWQFVNPPKFKILGYDAGKHRMQVHMTVSGRIQGTDWWLDESVVVSEQRKLPNGPRRRVRGTAKPISPSR
jgi:hypothetical protein